MDRIIDFLLEKSGESIKYRIYREMLNVSKENTEMKQLQDIILNKSKVKKIVKFQHQDGWIGNELHGCAGKALDSSVAALLSYGVEKDNCIFIKVIESINNLNNNVPYRTTFRGGESLDLHGRGGNQAILADILASLEQENNKIVINQINLALEHLNKALSYSSIDDFSELTKNKLVRYYKPNAYFPGSNHFSLLSATQGWRTTENIKMVQESFEHCLNIMLSEHNCNIMFKSNSHFVGPFNFNWYMFDFNIDKIYDDSYALVWWLRNLYKISRIGFIKEVKIIAKQYEYLQYLLTSGDLYKKQTEKSLQRFRNILAIEDDWKMEEKVSCDVFFIGMIILHNAGYKV